MRGQIVTLGSAYIAESAVQFFTPIVLVRVLDESAFGEYRLLWLTAGTLFAIFPFGVPGSLAYFLPRHELRDQAVFVRQALLYMATAGLLAGLVLSPLNPLRPHAVGTMTGAELAAPLFWALWVFASTLDILPNAERRIELQAGLIIGLALLRGAAVIAAALVGGIEAVIAILALVAGIKAFLLVAVATARYGWQLWSGQVFRWLEQAKFAMPVGAAAAAYLLRLQVDQWLVVLLFGAAQYGVYSIGAMVPMLAGIIRTTVSNVIIPEMSKAEAQGDLAKVLSLNNRSNVAIALVVFPALAYLFAAASPVIRLIFTDAYSAVIPVVRLSIVASLIAAVEMSTVMLVLRQGPYLLYTGIAAIPIGLLASYAGSQLWGMPGAAAGLIVGHFFAISVVYARAARLAALPVRAVQDWRTIARIAAAASIAGLAAYAALLLIPSTLGHGPAILVSGVVFCCAYLPSLVGLGQWGLFARILALPPDLPRQLQKHLRNMVR